MGNRRMGAQRLNALRKKGSVGMTPLIKLEKGLLLLSCSQND